jgi:hypothetical protein
MGDILHDLDGSAEQYAGEGERHYKEQTKYSRPCPSRVHRGSRAIEMTTQTDDVLHDPGWSL